jgi:hypothetical protein
MKTGTEALSARFIGADLGPSLVVPSGDAWPQSRPDVIKHPQVTLLGERRGAEWERRIAEIIEGAKARGVDDLTILLIAEASNTVANPMLVTSRLLVYADSLDVVFFARRQEFAVQSWLAQRVQSWTQPAFTDLSITDLLADDRKFFRYDKIVERWTDDTIRLIPIPYFESDRKSGELFQRFSKATGIAVPEERPGTRVNESLGKSHLLELGALKQRLAWARAVPLTNRIAQWWFNQVRARLRGGVQSDRWKLTTAERNAIVRHFADSNAAFKKSLGAAARRDEWKRWFAAETR